MNRLFLLTAASAALALSAHAESKTYDIGSFSALDVSRDISVVYEAGERQSIRVESESGDFDRLNIEVYGDRLEITRNKAKSFFGRNRGDKFTVYITAPAISSIKASSGSRVDATGIAGEYVSVDVSSSSTLKAHEVSATYVVASSSSGSSIEIAGECQMLDADSSSRSSIEADRLKCLTVEASASSRSSIEAHASQKAHGNASPDARIEIDGGATEIHRNPSSGSSVQVR